MTLPAPVIFSILLYFGVIIANSQLPEYSKTRKIIQNCLLQKSFTGAPDPADEAHDAPKSAGIW